MKNIDKIISSQGYGIGIVSAPIFQELYKKHKIRTKKMLTYFDKNNNSFYDFIQNGAFIPISHIQNYYYQVFFNIGNAEFTDNQWLFIHTWGTFNLEVKDETIWVFSFEQMEHWCYKDLQDIASIETYYYLSYEGEKNIAYKGVKYTIPNGKYSVKIIGMRRKQVESEEKFRKGYAFLLQLNKVDEFTQSNDSSLLDFSILYQ